MHVTYINYIYSSYMCHICQLIWDRHICENLFASYIFSHLCWHVCDDTHICQRIFFQHTCHHILYTWHTYDEYISHTCQTHEAYMLSHTWCIKAYVSWKIIAIVPITSTYCQILRPKKQTSKQITCIKYWRMTSACCSYKRRDNIYQTVNNCWK